jgi:MFS family permease
MPVPPIPSIAGGTGGAHGTAGVWVWTGCASAFFTATFVVAFLACFFAAFADFFVAAPACFARVCRAGVFFFAVAAFFERAVFADFRDLATLDDFFAAFLAVRAATYTSASTREQNPFLPSEPRNLGTPEPRDSDKLPLVLSTPAEPDAQSSDAPQSWTSRVAGALTHRNFRLIWFAALGSTIGTWMQKFAQSWLVLDLTDSNFYLGLDDFLSQLPILLFMLIGGVIADRADRRKLLTWSQYVQAFSAFALAAVVFWDVVTIWHVLALSFISGLGQAFGGPAYQSLLPSLVPRRDLPNAIALNSTQFNLSRILGPTLGTGILVTIGMAACFFLNGLSFFLVVVALLMIKVPPPAAQTGPRRDIMTDLKQGLNYVRSQRLMVTLIVLVVISMALAMPLMTFLPTFAKNVMASAGGTPETRLSLLMACQGLGAIAGALLIGLVSGRSRQMGRYLMAVQVLTGLVIIGFGLSTSPLLSYVLIFLGGIAFMALFSMSFSIVQLAVPEELRGRVVSIYMVAVRGGGPIGALIAGYVADLTSAPTVLIVNGALLSIITLGVMLSGRGSSLKTI